MELFAGIPIEDKRECLLSALRRLRDPDAAKNFEQNFKSLERLWEAVAPDPCLYPHRFQYNWLCGIYVAHRRRQRGSQATYGELSAKTRELIEENTTFVRLAEELPVFKIDKDYITKIDDLPSPADKAAALEAALTAELAEGDQGFTYRQLGERLQTLRERKEAKDQADEDRLRELAEIADEAVTTKEEPGRLGLTNPGEYGLYTVLRAHSSSDDDVYVADCARAMVAHLVSNHLLSVGWSNSKGGRMRVEQSLLAESWNARYVGLGFDPAEGSPAFLVPAVEELATSDQV
jgi:type I restriction enzyme R subunit